VKGVFDTKDGLMMEHAMKPFDLGVITGLGDAPAESLRKVRELGLHTAQLFPGEKYLSADGAAKVKQALADTGVEATCVFCGYAGERYDDIPTVPRTVGLVPRDTRAVRVQRTKAFIDFTAAIGCPNTAGHIGFIPEDSASADYRDLVKVMQEICDHAAKAGRNFALETGQETAEVLLRFIKDVNRPNLKVNFDPANMLLYGSGEPIAAVKMLGSYVVGVHGKDGKRPTEKDKLGHEFPLGQGDVGVERFISTLKEIGYKGAVTIEREISGEQQRKDIAAAIDLLESVKRKLGL